MRILVQKETRNIHTNLQNNHIGEYRTRAAVPQDMKTFSRSFFFTITSKDIMTMDFSEPGTRNLELCTIDYWKNIK